MEQFSGAPSLRCLQKRFSYRLVRTTAWRRSLWREDFRGQGNKVGVDFDDPTWLAAVGLVFDVPFLESSLFEIRPTLSYRGENLEAFGQLTTVVWADFTPPEIPNFLVFRSRPDKDVIDHLLGPSLELGVVLSRDARPIRTSLFIAGHFLFLVSDDTTDFGDAHGQYSLERDTFQFRGSAGVRFSWMGFAP